LTSISVRGVDLWVEQVGHGPDVVFISGLADEANIWAGQVAELSDSFRVTTFDNRGVGRSSTPDGEYRIVDFAEDTVALMAELGITQAHIVGESMGGCIAQQLVLDHPSLVRSLIMHGTWCTTDRYFSETIRGWEMLARSAATPREFFVAVSVWFLAPRIYNEGTIDEWASEVGENPYAQSVDAFCRTSEALLYHDTRDRLKEITCPTLVTVGTRDICTPMRLARAIVDTIPGAQFYAIEGGGHMAFVEDPPTFNAVLKDFLSKIEAV